MQYLTTTSTIFYRWRNVWLTLRSILVNLRHQDKLTSLVAWAKRKRLHKPQQLYEYRLSQVEIQLCWFRMRYKGLVVLCEFLLTAYKQLTPAPRFYRKGSGAIYRGY